MDTFAFKQYFARLMEILEKPLPLAEDTQNELNPPITALSPEAKSKWVEFHDAIESQLAPNKELHRIRGLAGKAPEHAIRIAAVLALINNPSAKEISLEQIGQES